MLKVPTTLSQGILASQPNCEHDTAIDYIATHVSLIQSVNTHHTVTHTPTTCICHVPVLQFLTVLAVTVSGLQHCQLCLIVMMGFVNLIIVWGVILFNNKTPSAELGKSVILCNLNLITLPYC